MEPSLQYDIEQQAKEEIYGDDWTQGVQDKLLEWKEEAGELSALHNCARRKWRVRADCLALPLILASGCTTMLIGLNSLEDDEIYTYASLVSSGVVTVLSGIIAHYSSAERSERHNEVSTAYGSLVRDIDYDISLPPSKRCDIEVTLTKTTNSFNAIGSRAPAV